MQVTILGSGGGAPSPTRETSCVLVEDGEHALLLDAGSGTRRFPAGNEHIDVVLTHFHFDHVCGLSYLYWLGVETTIWAPGQWLYDRASADILAPLLQPPISPNAIDAAIEELHEGTQSINGFVVRAAAQLRHWAPSAGLRVDDMLAYITDTPYEESSVELARGVRLLLHEAWTGDGEHDATAADAERVAREAAVDALALIHLDPRVESDVADGLSFTL